MLRGVPDKVREGIKPQLKRFHSATIVIKMISSGHQVSDFQKIYHINRHESLRWPD